MEFERRNLPLCGGLFVVGFFARGNDQFLTRGGVLFEQTNLCWYERSRERDARCMVVGWIEEDLYVRPRSEKATIQKNTIASAAAHGNADEVYGRKCTPPPKKNASKHDGNFCLILPTATLPFRAIRVQCACPRCAAVQHSRALRRPFWQRSRRAPTTRVRRRPRLEQRRLGGETPGAYVCGGHRMSGRVVG